MSVGNGWNLLKTGLKTGTDKKTKHPEWVEPTIIKVNKKHDASMAKAQAKGEVQEVEITKDLKAKVKKEKVVDGKLTLEQCDMISALKKATPAIKAYGDIAPVELRKIVRIGDDMPYKAMLALIDGLLIDLK